MRGSTLVVAMLAICIARPAEAGWNPLERITAAGRKVGRTIGNVLGVGGFVESATGPTIRNAEESGRRLINDVDAAIGRQLDHAGAVATATLHTVDRSIEARIVQVDAVVNRTIDYTFDRVNDTIGRVDDLARRRIDQIAARAGALIDKADQNMRNLLAQAGKQAAALLDQVDAMIGKRTEDVHQLVSASIQQADEVAAERIEQLDEIAGRRIGSIDVIVTKQSMAIEVMLLRVGALLGLVAFLGFVLWRLFKNAAETWQKMTEATTWRKIGSVFKTNVPVFVGQAALGAAGVLILYVLSDRLPDRTRSHMEQQIVDHERALDKALAAYDFTDVRYHSTQLELLEPGSAPRYRALARKAELLRTVLGRPALLQTVAGVRQVAAEIDGVDKELAADPDVPVLKAIVVWRVGTTRRDEYDAAVFCRQALELGAKHADPFLLEPLARNYLAAYLHDPVLPDGVDAAAVQDLAAFAQRLGPQPENARFQHLVAYNALIAKLDRASSTAYLDMLDAHVAFVIARGDVKKPEPAEATAARGQREAAARRVIAAWQEFDRELETSPWLVGDPVSLAAFLLDDAVLSHALYYVHAPGAIGLPPGFLDAKSELSVPQRIKTAPLRVEWGRRYATLVGPNASDVLALEETRRFARFERRASEFERAYVAFATARTADAKALADQAIAAIRSAADIGLVRDTAGGRRPVAALLVETFEKSGGVLPPELRAELANASQQRRLRFL